MPTRVEVTLEAKDNASATLQNVKNQLVIFDQFGRTASDLTTKVDTTTRALGGMDISVSKLTRGVKGLAIPLASELSPALGQTASAMGQVATSALVFGRGLGVLTVAAAALAGLLGGKLIQSYRDAAAAAEKWARAVELSDVAALTAGVEKEAEAVRTLAKEYRELEERAKRARQESRGLGPEAAGIAGAHEGQVRSSSDAAREAKRRELEQAERDLEGARAAQSIGASFSDMTKPWLGASEAITKVRQAEAEALKKSRTEFERAQDFLMGSAGGWGFSVEEFESARKAVEGSRERDVAREHAAIESMFALGEVPTSMGLASGDVERVGTILAKLDQDRIRIQREALDVLRDTTALQLEAVGLSREETRAIEEQAIARQHALELAIAGDDQARQRLADLRATTGLRRIAERDEAIPGLLRGIDDVEKEFGSAGLRMQQAARDVGAGVYTSLADAMFAPIEARMQGLPPLFQGILGSMARAATDLFAKEITAQLFGGLKSLFPGGGTAGSVPFAEGAGSGSGPLLTAAGRPLPQSELATAYAAAGDQGIRALQQGRATVVGGEFIPETFDLPGFSTGPSASALTASRFNVQQGLQLAGNTAALGLAAYTASQNTSTAGTFLSAGFGALAGAGLGASLATSFPSLGLSGTEGGIYGAVAAAAIAGTIALLAKQESDKQAKQARAAAEIERLAGTGSDLARSAAGAVSLPDFFRRVTAFGSGYTGGTSPVAISTTVQTPTGRKPIGIENPTYEVATLQDLLAAPESLQAMIQAGVAPDLLAGPNAATSAALQAIARDLVDQFREAEQGVGLTQEDRLGGLTRRTTYPASRADMLNAALPVEIDELALQALSDDDRAVLLLDVMGRVAVDQDIQSTISDGATGAIVSITRIARSTIPLPPEAAPGVPAGAREALGQVAGLNIPAFKEPFPRGEAIYGAPLYDYIQTGEGGYYVQQPGNTGPITGYAAPSAEQVAAYQAAKAEFYRPYLEQTATATKEQLAALTPAEVTAAITAGILTPTAVAALIQAGFLPQIAATLPPEVRAQIGELQTDAGGNVTVGLPAGISSGAVDFASLPPGTFSEAGVQALLAALPFPTSVSFPGQPTIGLPSNLTALQQTLMGGLQLAGKVVGLSNPVALVASMIINGLLGFGNVLSAAVAGAQAAQSGYADAFVGGQGPAPATTDGLTFAQQLAFAAQGVPFVADPTAPTGYSIDPTFGYVDANGNIQGYHTAGNPSGLPTNPNTTNFGEGEGNTSGASPTSSDAPSDGGVQGP